MALGTNIEYKASALFQATLDEKSATKLENRFVELSKNAAEMSKKEFAQAFQSLGAEINRSLAKLGAPQIDIKKILNVNSNLEAFSALGSEFGESFNNALEAKLMSDGNIKRLLEVKRMDLQSNSLYARERRSTALKHLTTGENISSGSPALNVKDFSNQDEQSISQYMDSLYATIEQTLTSLKTISAKTDPKAYKQQMLTLENLIATYIEGVSGLQNIPGLSGNSKYSIKALQDITSKYGLGQQHWVNRRAGYQDAIAKDRGSVEYNSMLSLFDAINQLETQAQFATKSIQEINGALNTLSSLSRPAQKNMVKDTEQVLDDAKNGKGGQVGRAFNVYQVAVEEGADWVTLNAKALQFLTRFNAMDPVKQAGAERDWKVLAGQLNPMIEQITSSLQMFVDAANRRLYPGYGTGTGTGYGTGSGGGTGSGDGTGGSGGVGDGSGITSEDIENTQRLTDAEARRLELVKQLDHYAERTLNADAASYNLEQREKIYQVLMNENLMTEELEQNYRAINTILEQRYNMLNSAREHEDDPSGLLENRLHARTTDPMEYYDEWVKPFEDDISKMRTSGLFDEGEIQRYEMALESMQNKLSSLSLNALDNLRIDPNTINDVNKLNDILEQRNQILSLMKTAEDPLGSASVYQEELQINEAIKERIALLQHEGENGSIVTKQIQSYEELCSVVERYNKLVAQGGIKSPADMDVFDDVADKLSGVMSDSDLMKFDSPLDVNQLATQLGIEIPEAANTARQALNSVAEQAKLVQQYNANKEKTLALLKKEQLSYEEILYLVKEYQTGYGKQFYQSGQYDLGDEALGLDTDIARKLLHGNMISGDLSNALSGVEMSAEDGARILEDYQNRQIALEEARRAQDELNKSRSQEPKTEDETPQIESENEALQKQREIIRNIVNDKTGIGLNASQTTLGITNGTEMLGGNTLDKIKDKQKALKAYLQELMQIEAQEKKNGLLTAEEVARKEELVRLVQEMSFAVRYKDGSYYQTSDFGDRDQDLSQQIEQLNQILNLRKQIALGYYHTGSYGTIADTFNGDNITSLMYAGIGEFDDIEQFNSSMIGQLIREYQLLHEQMLKCMLVGQEVPQDTLNRMKWFESLDTTQLEGLLPKLTELQGKIQAIQGKEGLTELFYNQDDAYYDQKIQDLNTLLALQKEYLSMGGPVETMSWDTDLHYTNEELQEYINQLNVAKQGAQDVARILQQFTGIDLKSIPGINSALSQLSRGWDSYDTTLSNVTQMLERSKELTGQLGGFGSDSEDISVLNNNLAKRKEIYDSLYREGLLTEQIKMQYNAVNQEILEKITLLQKAQSVSTGTGNTDTGGTGSGTGTGTGSGTTQGGIATGSGVDVETETARLVELKTTIEAVTTAITTKTQAFTAEETEVQRVVGTEQTALNTLKTTIEAITTAVGSKTTAFTNSEAEAQRVVTSEIGSLDLLEQKVITIKGTLESLFNNLRNGSSDISAGLSNITVTVNHNDAVDTEQKGAWALDTTAQSIKGSLDGVRGDISNVVSAIGNINTKASYTDVGNVLATENTLVAIKGVLDAINGKVQAGTKTATNTTSTDNSMTTSVAKGGTDTDTSGVAGSLSDRIKTAFTNLFKYKTTLQEANQLSGDLEVGINNLYAELSKVSDKAGLSTWKEHFTQFKNASSILQTLAKDYQALGQAQARAVMETDTLRQSQYLDDAQIIQDRIATKIVDVNVRDNRFEEARQRAYNATVHILQQKQEVLNATKAENVALTEQEKIFGKLITTTELYNKMTIGAAKATTPEEKAAYEQEANSALAEQQKLLQGITLTKEQQAQYDELAIARVRQTNLIQAQQIGAKNASAPLLDAKINTQFSSLSLLYNQLESTGVLTDVVKQEWMQLWDSLSTVQDSKALAVWQQQLAQVKNHIQEIANANKITTSEQKTSFEQLISVTQLYNQMATGAAKATTPEAKAVYEQEANSALVEQRRILQGITLTKEQQAQYDALEIERIRQINILQAQQTGRKNQIHNAQVEAEIVKRLVALYEQLGRAQFLGNTQDASSIRQKIGAERANLSSVDYATDMKFFHAKEKGYNAEKTKAENAALKEQEGIISRLNALYQEYGVLVERASATKGTNFGNQIADEATDKFAEIQKLIGSLRGGVAPEIQHRFDEAFDRGKAIESRKQYEAIAKKSDQDEITRLKNIENLEKEIGKLRADADAVTDTGIKNALEREIQLRQDLIALQKQGLAMDAQDEAYYRQMYALRTKQARLHAKESQKSTASTFAEEIKKSQKEAGLKKSESTVTKADDALMSAMKIPGISLDQINNLELYKGKILELKSTIANFPQDDLASEAQKNQLINQRLEVDAYTKKIQELIANYERLSGENTEVMGTSSLGLGAAADAYQKELTQTIMAQTEGKASIKSYDAQTKTLTYTLKTGKGEFTQYAASVRQADGALVSVRGTTTKAMGVFESIGKKIKEYSYYFTGSMMIYRVIAWVREGVTAVKEIDSALTELKKVTDETEESYAKFLDTAAKTAEKVGSTIKDVVSSTADWARLGYSMKDAAQLAESTQILMNVSEFTDISTATDSLISSIQAFKYTAEESMDVVDIMNTIGNNYAISTADLATSLTKSSGSLVAANGTLEEAVALTATANTIIQDADVVGKNSLPTLKVAILVKVQRWIRLRKDL